MAKEIERKYRLVKRLEKFLEIAPIDSIRRIGITQGYLSFDPEVRVRLKQEMGEIKATLTIKGKGELVRDEFEYEIPVEEACELLRMCGEAIVKKTRWVIGKYEIDIFHSKLYGLVLVEVELESEDEEVTFPEGVEVIEVTNDPRYKNKNLARVKSLKDLGLEEI